MMVTFRDLMTEAEWSRELEVVPRPGEAVTLDSMPEGHRLIVAAVEHYVGGGEHRIVVAVQVVTPRRPQPQLEPNAEPARSAAKPSRGRGRQGMAR